MAKSHHHAVKTAHHVRPKQHHIHESTHRAQKVHHRHVHNGRKASYRTYSHAHGVKHDHWENRLRYHAPVHKKHHHKRHTRTLHVRGYVMTVKGCHRAIMNRHVHKISVKNQKRIYSCIRHGSKHKYILTAKQRQEIQRWRKQNFNLKHRIQHGGKRKAVMIRHEVVLIKKKQKAMLHDRKQKAMRHNRKHMAVKGRMKPNLTVSNDNSLQQLINSERQSGLPLIDINQVNPLLAQNNMQINNLPQFGE